MPKFGPNNPPPGRKGRPNKATANAREAIARLVDGFSPRLEEWLEEIYQKEGPQAAWRCFSDVEIGRAHV